MPVRPLEIHCHPPQLFDGETINARADQRLWVLHTKPRQEKSLARELYKQNIPYYLPLITKRKKNERRSITTQLPVFTSYLFLLGNDDERIGALKTQRVVQQLGVADQHRLWRDLYQLKRLLATPAPIQAEDKLPVGTIVEICSGPLCGMFGKLVGVASSRRFVVEVDFLQKGASIQLDENTELRPCEVQRQEIINRRRD